MNTLLDQIKWDKEPTGLVPAVVQDSQTKDVLMLGFMNREALEKTLQGGYVTFWQRSRQKLWTKGETSGNTLGFVSLRINCNSDSLLIMARPVGATCHTGHPTCYYRETETEAGEWRTITQASLTRNKSMPHARKQRARLVFIKPGTPMPGFPRL